MTREQIVEKIRKLIGLQSSPNENEAALATQRIQEILSAHGMEMVEVDSAGNKSGSFQSADIKRGKYQHNKSAMYNYQRKLMGTLAGNNFCMYWIEKTWQKDVKGNKIRFLYSPRTTDESNGGDMGRVVDTHMMIGREENVMGVQIMYDYLIQTMDRLLPYQGMEKRGRNALLWLDACTERLCERLEERRHQMQEESEAKAQQVGYGIVLASVYSSEDDDNNDIKWGRPVGTTSARKREEKARYAITVQKENELIAGGMDYNNAWYVARGMNIPEKTPKPDPIPETESKRKKREAKEERESEIRYNSHNKRMNEQLERRSQLAFRQGLAKAEDIGLHDQVKGKEQGSLV
jgi:hypothetical protein